MGGSSGGAPAVEQPAQPAQPVVPVTDYAAFSPGQQGLLAQQMQQGFGGSLLDHQNAMGFYQDMQVPQIQRPEQIAQYLQQIGVTPSGGTQPTAQQQEPLIDSKGGAHYPDPSGGYNR